ncbi:hypothetical protein [Paenibacillus contaminans]|nr:hypothetical protein [Paenibacillus contaminans]
MTKISVAATIRETFRIVLSIAVLGSKSSFVEQTNAPERKLITL